MTASGADVSLRGRGSGQVATDTSDAEEPLHLLIVYTSRTLLIFRAFNDQELTTARGLCRDLLNTVQKEYVAEYGKMLSQPLGGGSSTGTMDPAAVAAYYSQYYAQYYAAMAADPSAPNKDTKQ